jgi:citrate lyase alpha subunit
MLSALSLIIPANVPLYEDVLNGTFKPLTARGFLQELHDMLSHTEMKSPCIFRSNHVSNLLPVGGTLPKDKAAMLNDLEMYIPSADDIKPLLNDTGNF